MSATNEKAPIKGLVSTEHLAVGTVVYLRQGAAQVYKSYIQSVFIRDEVMYALAGFGRHYSGEGLFLTADEAFAD